MPFGMPLNTKIALSGGLGLLSGLLIDRTWIRLRLLSDSSGQDCQESSVPSPAFISVQQHRHQPVNVKLPGLPLPPFFGTVSAKTEQSHIKHPFAQSHLPVAAKSLTPDIPPEPPHGASRSSQIMRFGFPGLDNILARKDYVLSYDRRNRTAHWVLEHLTKESVARNDDVSRRNSFFVEDSSIHPYFRSQNSDYKNSGFDRGHLVAAGNHRLNQEVCDETFLLSNMSPQVGNGFNRDKWEHLERYVRSLTKLYKNVYVCTGPLYLPKRELDGNTYVKYQVIGANNVAVPTHFFKVVVGESGTTGALDLEAYVLPNEPIPDHVALHSFQVPPDAVERASGLLFFDKLNRANFRRINGQQRLPTKMDSAASLSDFPADHPYR